MDQHLKEKEGKKGWIDGWMDGYGWMGRKKPKSRKLIHKMAGNT